MVEVNGINITKHEFKVGTKQMFLLAGECHYFRIKPEEWNDWQCPKCAEELMQFSKWRRTGKLEDAPIGFLERIGILTKQQAEELRKKQTSGV